MCELVAIFPRRYEFAEQTYRYEHPSVKARYSAPVACSLEPPELLIPRPVMA